MVLVFGIVCGGFLGLGGWCGFGFGFSFPGFVAPGLLSYWFGGISIVWFGLWLL